MEILKEKGLKGVNFIDDNFTVDIYKEARKNGVTVSMMLEEYRAEKRGEESPYIGMDKAEVLRTKAQLRATTGSAPQTALEEALQKSGIRMHDKVEKFFSYGNTELLFPELISDQVYSGELKNSQVDQIVFNREVIDLDVFQKLYLDQPEKDLDLREVAKLEDLPETTIKTSDRVISLNMYGRYLKISKYDRNKMSIKALSRFLDLIGLQIAVRKTDLMYYRARNGDGNTGSTPGSTLTCSDGANAISFKNTVAWAAQLPTPYKMDKFAVRKTNWITWITRLYDGSTTSIGNDKFNAFPDALEWDRSAALTTNYGIGFDTRYAIEEVSTGAPLVEAENIVRQVGEGTAISTMFEFTIGDNNAIAVLDMSS